MSCYWHHSCGIAAKLAVSRYFFQRMLFKVGILGTGENKLSCVKLQGHIIYFNLRSPEIGFFGEIFLDQVYEQEKEFIPQNGWTVFDIGANIGLFALRNSSRVARGKIICFEPNDLVYQALQKNIRVNKLSNVEPYPLAIGGDTGQIEFQVSPYSSGSGSIMPWRLKNSHPAKLTKVLVSSETLDFFCKKRNINEPIDLIKMDIEGAEFEALSGGAEVLQRTKRIVMEYHGSQLLPKITLKLRQAGFKLIRLLPAPNQIAYFLRET